MTGCATLVTEDRLPSERYDLSLLEALENPPAPRRKIDAILLSVPAEEKVALQQALSNAEWGHERLAEVLTTSGHPVSEASIRRYRKRVLGWVN